MKLLDNLQRRFGRFAVPHATEGLIACQVLTYLLAMGEPGFLFRLVLIPRLVFEGEVWRLATFICTPPTTQYVILAAFFWYMFYMMGTALENTWGVFRYNVFLLTGYVATVASAFLQPDHAAPIAFLQGSVFLAFAWLFPDFEILLFFILPVKIKWLAMLQWLCYAYLFVFGDWWTRLFITSSVFNFLVFFWREIYDRMKAERRHMAKQAANIPAARVPRHTCAICGVNSDSHPKMSFRYCSKCYGGACYCPDHIHDHAHLAKVLE
jgi:hypothetical protein